VKAAAKFKTRREAACPLLDEIDVRMVVAHGVTASEHSRAFLGGGKNTPTGMCLARETACLGRGGPVPRTGGPFLEGGWRGSHAR